MGSVSISGTLTAGASGVGSSAAFPSAQVSIPFGLRADPTGYTAATGILQFPLNSAGSFIQLGGVDETFGPVKRATLVYLRVLSQVSLRITSDDGLGGEDVFEAEHVGLFLKEWPDDHAVLKVEAKGAALLEYFACGPA